MSAVAEKTSYTPEDLLRMPDGKGYELVDGALVERHRQGEEGGAPMGFVADLIAGELLFLLKAHLASRPLGWVFQVSSGGFQGFPGSPKRVRKPDVAFVAYGRFPGEVVPPGYANLAPDLAAEIVSPNDLYEEVDQKIEEYLRAGVRLVWIISPQNRTVRIYRANGASASAREDDGLEGEDVVPGFRCLVRELFPLAPQPGPASNGAPA